MESARQDHFIFEKENNSSVEYYLLAPGITILFNQIYLNTWEKGEYFNSGNILTLNFCIDGRCDVSLGRNQYAIVKKGQVCISTIAPDKDFYYPGKRYEGIQLFIDVQAVKSSKNSDFLSYLGIDVAGIANIFCAESGIYFRQMDENIASVISKTWASREDLDVPSLRYITAHLLHEMMLFPDKSERESYFTKSQIAIVREAESIILSDLSKRITAREMAERFGISESSFKLYVKGILGDSYLSFFRKKRMEKAAELLESTNRKVIDIAVSVGYENQGKFAKVFSDIYGVTPLEFRRLSK